MRRRLPPLRALEAVAAAAATGSVTRAAQRLHLAESAVSRQIRAVEDYLGEPLFLRQRMGLVLTPAGEGLLPAIADAFDGIEGAAERIRTGADTPALRVACDLAVAAAWLLPRWSAAPPSPPIRLHLVDGARPGLAPHVILTWCDRVPPAAEAVIDDAFGPVCRTSAPGGAGAGPPCSGVARLESETWPDAWGRWREAAGDGDASSAERLPVPHCLVALAAARAGLGAAIVARALVADDLAAGRLAAPFGFVAIGRRLVADDGPGLLPHQALRGARERFRAWLRLPLLT